VENFIGPYYKLFSKKFQPNVGVKSKIEAIRSLCGENVGYGYCGSLGFDGDSSTICSWHYGCRDDWWMT